MSFLIYEVSSCLISQGAHRDEDQGEQALLICQIPVNTGLRAPSSKDSQGGALHELQNPAIGTIVDTAGMNTLPSPSAIFLEISGKAPSN